MALNLVELVKQHLSDAVLDQMSNQLGENVFNTRKAVTAAVPTVLGGMLDATTYEGGADSLLGGLESFGRERQLLDNLETTLSDNGGAALRQAGSDMLDALFGRKLDNIAETLSEFSGIGTESASSLLGVVAPVAMSVLGKQQDDLGLDADGVTKLLNEQKTYIAEALPTELGQIAGLSDKIADAGAAIQQGAHTLADEAASAVSSTATTIAKTKPGGGLIKTIVGVVVIVFVVWVILQLFRT